MLIFCKLNNKLMSGRGNLQYFELDICAALLTSVETKVERTICIFCAVEMCAYNQK